MKILVVGATGNIGGYVLQDCLAHPQITSVVAFCRRPLPEEINSHQRLQCVIVKDFKEWPEETLKAHSDAAAMLWMIGTTDGSPLVNLEYPMTFQKEFARAMRAYQSKPFFRFIFLSGALVVEDQDKKLFFLNDSRKLRGVLGTKSMEFAKENEDIWKAYFPKPGGVIFPTMWATWLMGAVLGQNLSIRVEELTAYMTHLAVGSDESEGIIPNKRIIERGRELLKDQRPNNVAKS